MEPVNLHTSGNESALPPVPCGFAAVRCELLEHSTQVLKHLGIVLADKKVL
jgi:hypothetical protein